MLQLKITLIWIEVAYSMFMFLHGIKHEMTLHNASLHKWYLPLLYIVSNQATVPVEARFLLFEGGGVGMVLLLFEGRCFQD